METIDFQLPNQEAQHVFHYRASYAERAIAKMRVVDGRCPVSLLRTLVTQIAHTEARDVYAPKFEAVLDDFEMKAADWYANREIEHRRWLDEFVAYIKTRQDGSNADLARTAKLTRDLYEIAVADSQFSCKPFRLRLARIDSRLTLAYPGVHWPTTYLMAASVFFALSRPHLR